MPLSWRHFTYGMAYIGRQEARTALREAAATRAGQTTDEDYTVWRSDIKRTL